MQDAEMKTIEPGMAAELVFGGDETKDHIPSLKTIVCAVEDRHIVLSQTEPPITNAHLGKRFLITFLGKNCEKQNRYGFWAKLTAAPANYEIAPAKFVPVLVMAREGKPATYNLRMSYRVKPMMTTGLNVFLRGTAVNIVDISVGGVCIRTSKQISLKPQETVIVPITIDGKKFDVESMVIRTWSSQSSLGIQHFASLRFLSHPEMRESLLGKAILLMERERLANKLD